MPTTTAERPSSTAEPEMIGGDVAAKMASVCRRTLDDLPASLTGKAKLGRRTLYHVATLRAYLASLVAKPQSQI